MSHIFQYVKFCKLFEPNEEINFEWLICKRRLEKYLRFLEDIGKSANTIANHAKSHDHVSYFISIFISSKSLIISCNLVTSF